MGNESAKILRAMPVAAQPLLRSLSCNFTDPHPALSSRARANHLADAVAQSPVRSLVETILADVDALSDAVGEMCLRETVRDEAPGLFDALMSGQSAHERAAHVRLARPEVFERAQRRRFFSRYRLSKRACSRFQAPAVADWRPSGFDVLEFARALEPLLREQLRTGDQILVDPIVRDAGGAAECVQLSIYAEGRAQRIEEIEGDDLVERVIRPALECSVGYWPRTGGLEVVVRNGTFALRSGIARAFAETSLDAPADAVQAMAEPSICLDGLLARPIFELDLEDGISSVRVMELEIRSIAQPGVSITLSARDKASDAWTAAAAFVRDEALLVGIVMRAKIRVEYTPREGGRRRTVTFDLTPPHGYSPRGATDMERVVIEKYLPRWGIITAPDSAT